MADSVYWIWFASLFGYGTRRSQELLERVEGNPQEYYEETEQGLRTMGWLHPREVEKIRSHTLDEAMKIQERAAALGCSILTPDSPDYPRRLRNIYAPPSTLYVQGSLSGLDGELAIAMVGTRDMTAYGRKAANGFAQRLAQAGAVIVSGMAMGIDQISHAGALKAGGRTIAVLGSGIDSDYPPDSLGLRERTAANGAVITEYPPGTPPMAGRFPVRNRIISGLSCGVLVVEASEHSGSLITAGHALTQGRDVFAVPGSIFSPVSQGCNKLIKQGAKPVVCPMDVLEEYLSYPGYSLHPEAWGKAHVTTAPNTEPHKPRRKAAAVPAAAEKAAETPKAEKPAKRTPPDYLTAEQLSIYKLLDETPRGADSIAASLSMTIMQVLSSLTELEIYGLATVHPGRRFTI